MVPRPNPAVIYQPVTDGAVLFSPADETYFGLNAAGTAVWERLPPATSSWDELGAALHRTYPEIPPDVLLADAAKLIAELQSRQLVVLETPGVSGDTD